MHPLPSGSTDPSPGPSDRRMDSAAGDGDLIIGEHQVQDASADLRRSEIRQREIINAFVDLSHELVEDYDVVDVLSQLTGHCAHLLDIASAGLLIANERGVLHLAAASSERTHHLEIFQIKRDEGPCRDCFHSGQAVLVPDLEAEMERWPHFCQAASAVGFRSVHALPMRLSGDVLGALGLFGDKPGALDTEDLALAQALLHVASVAIVNDRSATGRATVNSQLQQALTSRIVVEQAKGAIAHAGDLNMEDAFDVLRRYARDHGTKLSIIASQVVDRDLQYETLIQHAHSVTKRP